MNIYKYIVTAKEDFTKMYSTPMLYTISCTIYAKTKEEAEKLLFSEIKEELGPLNNIITKTCTETIPKIQITTLPNVSLFFKILTTEVDDGQTEILGG